MPLVVNPWHLQRAPRRRLLGRAFPEPTVGKIGILLHPPARQRVWSPVLMTGCAAFARLDSGWVRLHRRRFGLSRRGRLHRRPIGLRICRPSHCDVSALFRRAARSVLVEYPALTQYTSQASQDGIGRSALTSSKPRIP